MDVQVVEAVKRGRGRPRKVTIAPVEETEEQRVARIIAAAEAVPKTAKHAEHLEQLQKVRERHAKEKEKKEEPKEEAKEEKQPRKRKLRVMAEPEKAKATELRQHVIDVHEARVRRMSKADLIKEVRAMMSGESKAQDELSRSVIAKAKHRARKEEATTKDFHRREMQMVRDPAERKRLEAYMGKETQVLRAMRADDVKDLEGAGRESKKIRKEAHKAELAAVRKVGKVHPESKEHMKMKKGSEEAKAHMAKLREMRKKK